MRTYEEVMNEVNRAGMNRAAQALMATPAQAIDAHTARCECGCLLTRTPNGTWLHEADRKPYC